MSGQVLRIAIDPELSRRFGPELHWTLRLLLVSAGWAWQEVALDAECELAYVADPEQAPRAGLRICADHAAWAAPEAVRLRGVGEAAGLRFPVFEHSAGVVPGARPASAGGPVCPRDLAFDVFWLATGQDEPRQPKDRHGFADLAGTPWQTAGVTRQALASAARLWLEQTLQKLGCPPPQPRWPHGRRAAAASGHDVDYPEVIRWLEPARVLARQGPAGLEAAWAVLSGRRHHWQFENWIKLEQSLGLRSAFYFVPRQGSLWEYATRAPDPFYDVAAPRFRALFPMLAEAGCEIGLHASYNAYQGLDAMRAEKERLEAACGRPVVGNRHHYWHLDPADPEATLRLHEQAGFLYDSSLIHNRYLGWRRGLAEPFFPFHRRERRELRTLQVPVAWMDDQFFGFRADNPGEPAAQLRQLADQAAEQGGCFVTDIHDYVFDPALFPGWTSLYQSVWERLRARGDVWFATPAEVAAHWVGRAQALRAASRGLELGLA